jgi:hypothetical protein
MLMGSGTRRTRGLSALLATALLAMQLVVVPVTPAGAGGSDVTNKNVELVSHLGGSGINRIAVAGDYVYAASKAGLEVFDVSVDATPVKVASVALGGEAREVAVSGGYAYVTGSFGGLKAVNVADPTKPREVGWTGNLGSSYGVAIVGDYAYTSVEHGIKCVNITDPANLRYDYFVGSPSGGSIYQVVAGGDKLYVTWGTAADNTSKVRVLDISHAAMQPRSSAPTTSRSASRPATSPRTATRSTSRRRAESR